MITYGELLGAGGVVHATQTTVLGGVTVSIGAADGAAMPGTSYAMTDPRFAYYGGHVAPWGVNYPRYLFERTYNLTLADGTKTGLDGTLAFQTDATSFDFRIYSAGAGTAFTILVDGQPISNVNIVPPNDGSLRYVHVDLSAAGLSPGFHSIEIACYGGADFGGLVVPNGSVVKAPADSGPRLVFLGDSFTEGNGAANIAADFPSYVAHALGMPDAWQSAFGGTGWLKTLGNRPNLLTRMEADGVGAEGDIYVIAMGINDAPGVTQAVVDSLNTLIAGRPGAKVFVVGAWNASAPEISNAAVVNEEIRAACAQVSGVIFLDPSQLYFPRWDAVHPSAEGQILIGQWLTAQIKYHLGIDGCVEQGIAGDTVGALFLEDFDPAASYGYQVLVDGVVSEAFEVVSNGDAFPVLKLADGVSLDDVGPCDVTVLVEVGGESIAIPVSFAVRTHREGSDGGDYIRFTSGAVSMEGRGGEDYLIAGAGEDRLVGGAGKDKLDGGGGADTLIGGLGGDYYFVDQVGDVVIEKAGEGYDTVQSLFEGYGLGADIEGLDLGAGIKMGFGNALGNYLRGNGLDNLLSGHEGDDRIEGFAGADTLRGGVGNDILDGGSGVDRLEGGAGQDTYYVDHTGDVVIEGAAAGSDRVVSTASSYTLANFIETLELAGTAVTGIGNALGNLLRGNAGDNILIGLAGNDTLDGAAGADRLEGGTGHDIYVVDRAQDTVIELAGEGHDTIQVAFAGGFTLSDNVEVGRLTASGDSLTGNAANNWLHANSAIASALFGGAGSDTLWALGGDDRLEGGTGNDVYYIDGLDVIVSENPGEGYDRVVTSVSGYTLAGAIEGLTLSGTADSASGNSGDNYLRAGTAAASLWGAGGNDRVDGSALADRLWGGDGNDNLFGFDGDDRLWGDAGNDRLTGGNGADLLFGGAGSDTLDGGSGNDLAVIGLGYGDCTLSFSNGSLMIFNAASGDCDVITGVEVIQFGDHAFAVDYASLTLAEVPLVPDIL